MSKETWRDIEGFPGYQVSDKGRVRSFLQKKHYPVGYGCYWYISDIPRILKASDDGNGYLKVMLFCRLDGKRYCRKVHRLVAEAFIAHSPEDDTVDHIVSGRLGKLNNRVENLRWISRRENIQKAYRDGMCRNRIRNQNKPIVATELQTGEEMFFRSIKEASEELGIERSNISHNLRWDIESTHGYVFEYADREDILLNSDKYYNEDGEPYDDY